MSDPFLGQLLLVGFNFAPLNWQPAAGQILPISRYTALFSLLGTMYGGNGTSTFGLPDLQGRVAIGYGQLIGGSYYSQGEIGGSTTITLIASETPNHTHAVSGAAGRGKSTPVGNAFAESTAGPIYSNASSPITAMNAAAITPFAGGFQPHNNMMSYLALNWVIALEGIFPSRN